MRAGVCKGAVVLDGCVTLHKQDLGEQLKEDGQLRMADQNAGVLCVCVVCCRLHWPR